MNRHFQTIVLVTLFVASVSVIAWAQHAPTAAPADDQAKPKMDCQMMGEHMQKMHSMMQKMDQQLDEKVETMNKASGDSKIGAMAEVINELVSQRKMMHEKMGDMQQKKMQHMALHTHMQMGMNEQGKKTMTDCPMMKPMMQGKPMMDGMHGQPKIEGSGDKPTDHGQHGNH